MKKPPALQVEEIPGDKFPSLEAAQRAALKEAAGNIAETMKRLLADGWFVIDDRGWVIPNPERIQRK